MTIGTSLSRRMHAAQVEAVAARQHDVQQDQVDGVGLQHPGHLGAVAGAERLEAFLAQQAHQEGAQGGIVLDDKNRGGEWRGRQVARQRDHSVARRVHMPRLLRRHSAGHKVGADDFSPAPTRKRGILSYPAKLGPRAHFAGRGAREGGPPEMMKLRRPSGTPR
jgi:hypothetical protein